MFCFRVINFRIPFYKRNIKFQDIFCPIYLLLCWFGLFPCNIKFSNSTKKYKILHKSVIFNAICAVFYNLIIISLVIVHVRVLTNESRSIGLTVMTTINYSVQLITLMMSCIVTYICSYHKRFNYANILNKLACSWFSLPNTNCYILRRLYNHTLICITILIMIVLSLIIVVCTREGLIWESLLMTFSFDLPQFILYVVITFYYMLMLTIRAVLSNIKENCLNLMKVKNTPQYYINLETKKSTVSTKYLELVYVQTIEVKCEIIKAFRMTIILILIQIFHAIVTIALTLYHQIMFHINISTYNIVVSALHLCFQILKLYALADSGDMLKIEVNEIARALHNIPIKQNIGIMMKVQRFSTLISYFSPVVTVYDFFPLDATLIFNVLASATTYFIIFVQLEKK
ncbi:uncharacterized protein LOC131847920 [Achroia grisella]|uniref:uncharacterized protein LOC131847920 n=1 Tax=Achroia grisella TaxID=688607 RepID=UPI0027D2850A|nr:uncharacterized protein LOC131847920 [Achroia grisella]